MCSTVSAAPPSFLFVQGVRAWCSTAWRPTHMQWHLLHVDCQHQARIQSKCRLKLDNARHKQPCVQQRSAVLKTRQAALQQRADTSRLAQHSLRAPVY
mmetsp:Transcript_7287/g.17590  ORF Transcript_7287/g.17590 Transcript_7287/m.17590 type:complete len:98 (+) Transcript_7287:652-945(+)